MLSAKEQEAGMLPQGFVYTLPTQAQWASLMADSTLEQAVTSVKNPRNGTAPVGSLQRNRLGLYDTRGNLWQWCLDPQDQPYRVLKGGAWNSSLEMNLRPDFRWYSKSPDERQDTFGFRVVLGPAR
jgi:formylglycine-generating enzyme required for sulfatase activity